MLKKASAFFITALMLITQLTPQVSAAGTISVPNNKANYTDVKSEDSILIASNPAGAVIFVDGRDTGHVTPYRLKPGAGIHTIGLSISGYILKEYEINSKKGYSNINALLLPDLPAAAPDNTIIVTNLTDLTNGDISGIAAIKTNPGPDGISLREAISAANNTVGSKRIEFSEDLKGGIIDITMPPDNFYEKMLKLTGGNICINGDIDFDGSPDITINSVFPGERPQSEDPLFMIWSDNIIISGIKITNAKTAIFVRPTSLDVKTVKNIKILGCVIEDYDPNQAEPGIQITSFNRLDNNGVLDSPDNVLIDNVIISGNKLDVPYPVWIMTAGFTQHDCSLSNLTIEANDMSIISPGIFAISMYAADCNSDYPNPPDPANPTRYADNNSILNTVIRGNRIKGDSCMPISISSANMGNRSNIIDGCIVENNNIAATGDIFWPVITVGVCDGSMYPNARAASDNSISNLTIRRNVLKRTGTAPIIDLKCATTDRGPTVSNNNMKNVVIEENELIAVSDYTNAIRINAAYALGWEPGMEGSRQANNNIIENALVINNHIKSEELIGASGIYIAGSDTSSDRRYYSSGNSINNISILGNTIQNYQNGITISGGINSGSTKNSVTAKIGINNISDGKLNIFNNVDGAVQNKVTATMIEKVSDKISTQAISEVSEAIERGLIPDSLLKGYQSDITRIDFCRIIEQLLTVKSGKTIKELLADNGKSMKTGVFTDTKDLSVAAVYSLGIIDKSGKNKFNPKGKITRQDAALYLYRTAKILGIENQNVKYPDYADSTSIAKSAVDAVKFVSGTYDLKCSYPILGDTGNGYFSPLVPLTKEQTIIAVKRLFNSKSE